MRILTGNRGKNLITLRFQITMTTFVTTSLLRKTRNSLAGHRMIDPVLRFTLVPAVCSYVQLSINTTTQQELTAGVYGIQTVSSTIITAECAVPYGIRAVAALSLRVFHIGNHTKWARVFVQDYP